MRIYPEKFVRVNAVALVSQLSIVIILQPWRDVVYRNDFQPVTLERLWIWEHRSGAKCREILVSCLSTFFASTRTIIVVLVSECFPDSQYSLVCFMFAVLLFMVPPCPAICKSGGTCPVPFMESASRLRFHSGGGRSNRCLDQVAIFSRRQPSDLAYISR